MATKRQLKKRISCVCGDLASDILLASHLFDNVNREKVDEIINEIASLQENTRAKATFAFDKTEKDFETKAAYRAARRRYNATAYAKLRKDFGEQAMSIVKQMNEAIPADIRKKLSPEA